MKTGKEQKAIEILPRGETTTFRANLVNVPTRLSAGDKLHYKFALLATPTKPVLRDSWDIRLVRHEPWGKEFNLPNRKIDGVPALDYFRDAGIRHLFCRIHDVWPHPKPVHEPFARALHRMTDSVHAKGLRLYNYLFHVRFPVVVPEFDIHGLHMSERPLMYYVQACNPPGNPRPGPIAFEYGANSQGTVFACPKSKAYQDTCIYHLAQRMDEYGDDGVYLDGTGHVRPCKNTLHGCGYRKPDGSIRPTYPVFANREFVKRIYTVVKQRRPNGVVDAHQVLPAILAYADIQWIGEQFTHLRHTGGAKQIVKELRLDMFRAEMMGYNMGVAAETLSYRLGTRMKVAAISLLHDIPVRPVNPYSHGGASRTASQIAREKRYFDVIARLWKSREQFGAKEAEKLFYWNNQDYVRVSPQQCYSTLLKHPRNGVWAFVSNLSADKQTVTVKLDLDKLGLRGRKLDVFNLLTGEAVSMTADGTISLLLGPEEWVYVWLRPKAEKGG